MTKLSDTWATPKWLFDQLNQEHGPFELDAAANYDNTKCSHWFGQQSAFNDCFVDGLTEDWSKHAKTVWVNPPYSNPSPWIRKALLEASKGVKTVMLLKADHSTKIYAECIYNYDKREFYPGVERIDLPKRIKFVPPVGLINKKTGKPVKAGSPNYPSMVVIFHPTNEST